jgi:hypothetical protein
MIVTFCLRLAFGMIAPLVLLPASVVPPRFFRVQFLAALGLMVVVGLFLGDVGNVPLWIAYAVAVTALVAGSVVWHTEEAPLGRLSFVVAGLALGATMVLHRGLGAEPMRIVDDFAAAGMVGSAISAMLMGHSYLIAPAMSIVPLTRLLCCLSVCLGLRIALACFGLWWTRFVSTGTLDQETILLLSARWLLGLVVPIVLVWMSWETARIRSTQSATGILYVVTVVVFLGELLSLILVDKTGMIL